MLRRRGRPKGSRGSKPRSQTTLSVSSPHRLPSTVLGSFGEWNASQLRLPFHFPPYLGVLDPSCGSLAHASYYAPLPRDPEADSCQADSRLNAGTAPNITSADFPGQGLLPTSLDPAAAHFGPSGCRLGALPRPRTEPSIAAPTPTSSSGPWGPCPGPCLSPRADGGCCRPSIPTSPVRAVPAACSVPSPPRAAAAAAAPPPPEAADVGADPSAAGAPDDSDPFHADWPHW